MTPMTVYSVYICEIKSTAPRVQTILPDLRTPLSLSVDVILMPGFTKPSLSLSGPLLHNGRRDPDSP